MSIASHRVELEVNDGRVLVARGPTHPHVNLTLLGPRRGVRGAVMLYTPGHAAWALRTLVHGATHDPYFVDAAPCTLELSIVWVFPKGRGPAPGARLRMVGRGRSVELNRDMVFDLAGLIEATERSWG